jgi:hypothetical protein
MNIGYSQHLKSDEIYKNRNDNYKQSLYRINTDQMYNNNHCLSVIGSRPSNQNNRGYDVSTTIKTNMVPAQEITDVGSLLSNRNIKHVKGGRVNDIDINKFKYNHSNICNDFLDPEYTNLTHPVMNYREVPINRFYNLPKNPQTTKIFWDFSENTKLTMRDNFTPKQSIPWTDRSQPTEVRDNYKTINCEGVNCLVMDTKKCPAGWKQ